MISRLNASEARAPLPRARRRPALALLLLAFASTAWARETVRLSGVVKDGTGRSRGDVRVLLVETGGSFTEATATGPGGAFRAAGLARGLFRVTLERAGRKTELPEALDLTAAVALHVEIVLTTGPERDTARLAAARRDAAEFATDTDINDDELRRLPAGPGIGPIIENMDFSATTNRIDIGGLWSSTPPLWSSRGSASWTQSVYRLNGLDVTDPYEGGRPLFLPDVWSLASLRLVNGALPAEDLTPGGSLRLTTKSGGETWRGAASLFGLDGSFSSSNITPRLVSEGLTESHRFASFFDGNFALAGPLVPGRLYLFTSLTATRWARDLADYAGDDESAVTSGTIGLSWRRERSDIEFLWTGQAVDNPMSGAGRGVEEPATLERRDLYNVVQAVWTFRPRPGRFFQAGLGGGLVNIHERFPDSAGTHARDLFAGLPSGAAERALRGDRSRFTAFFRGESLSAGRRGTERALAFGAEISRAFSSTREEIRNGLHLLFFEGRPIQVVRFENMPDHGEESFRAGAFVQETVTFPDGVSLRLGLHADLTRGARAGAASATDAVVSWFHLAPRAGLAVPLGGNGAWALRVHAGRYYYALPHSWLVWGHPGASGGLVYAWTDANHDGRFDAGEAGRLIRRDGPLFGTVDPKLRRPFADELSLGVVRSASTGLTFSLTGYWRETRNLVSALNTGVPSSSYDERLIFDIGDNRIPGDHDDLELTVYEQRAGALGKDAFLLTNQSGERRGSSYQGLDLILARRTPRFLFYIVLTALQISGTANPGSSEYENDEGVIGSLDTNPNTLLNARGRLRFDRGYTGRIGLAADLPLGFQFGSVVKYWDGQPFARRIIVTGFAQGPFYVMAHYRGYSRFEFNMNVDLRLEKPVALGRGTLRLIVDGFNVTNFHLDTAENEWTGPEYPLRFATEIESPRVFRLGLRYEF